MIVPLALMISSQMQKVRELFLKNNGKYKFSNFDNIPDCIFNTGKESENTNKLNSQRTTICLVLRDENSTIIESTDLLRWQKSERGKLFVKLNYADITRVATLEHFPMVGDQVLVGFLQKIQGSGRTIKELIEDNVKEDQFSLYIPTRARYFIPASPEDFHRNNQMKLSFSTEEKYNYAFILLSSNVFYWYWRAFGDGFDVATRDIYGFPLPMSSPQKEVIQKLALSLKSVIPECKVYKLNGGKLIPNINFNKRLDILLKIDQWICDMSGYFPEIDIRIFANKKSNSFLSNSYEITEHEDEEDGEE